MVRAKGRYRNKSLELERPLAACPRVRSSRFYYNTRGEARVTLWMRAGSCSARPGSRKFGTTRKTPSTTTGRSSMEFSAGDVVLVPFPYRDRLAESARPAIVVSDGAYNRQGDVVVAAITSHAVRFASDATLADWASAGLKMPSTARMLLATVASSRVLHHIGHLSAHDWAEVKSRLRLVFGST